MDFHDLVTPRLPPPNRLGKASDVHEHHLYEGAVMLDALHLLRTLKITEVHIHPDGEHGKQFAFADWLPRYGFARASSTGNTIYGGAYTNSSGGTVVVTPVPGRGDVVAVLDGVRIIAECKGGIINTRHAGQVSRLRKGLHEVVGMLMGKPREGRQIGVVPFTTYTHKLALSLAPRCAEAGIEIALVKSRGEVVEVKAGT